MARLALHVVLTVLAGAMSLMSRVSSRFRAALSRDRVIALATKDGVAYHFVISGRRLKSRRGTLERAEFTLTFTTAAQALRCLLSPTRVGKILNGILDRSIEHQGSLVLLLWFDGRVEQVVPLREPIRRRARFPGAYVKPRQGGVSASITREPAKAVLDPDWDAARRQRDKLALVRVAAGEPPAEY